jgi:hypothetical protein
LHRQSIGVESEYILAPFILCFNCLYISWNIRIQFRQKIKIQ